MQAYFHKHGANLQQHELLIRHDEFFFLSTARLALDVVMKVSGSMGAQLSAVLRRYEPAIRIMIEQPSMLIHGAYRPPNVLVVVGEAGATERVCPIDWEEAALGSPLYDVAYLSDGFEPPRLDEMWDAYRCEAESGGMIVPGRREMKRVVDCFRAHKLLNLLGKSLYRNYPLASVGKMIGMADGLIGSVQ